jgi:hypothetical protein
MSEEIKTPQQKRMEANIERYENTIRSNLKNIQMWRAEGFSAPQIAQKLDIPSKNILYMFLHRMNELKAAWYIADRKLLEEFLEPAIQKRAEEGFHYVEETEELLRNSDGEPILDDDGKPRYAVTKRVHKVSPCNNMLLSMASKLDKARWGTQKDDSDKLELELSEELNEFGG